MGRKRKGSGCLKIFVFGAGLLVLGSMVLGVLIMRFIAPAVMEVPVPPYQVLVGERFHGAGFHIGWQGENYIVTSQHQFGGNVPTEMMVGDSNTIVPITAQVHAEGDVQIMRYNSAVLDAIEPLRFDPAVSVGLGDAVALLVEDSFVLGKLILPPGPGRHGRLVLNQPFGADDMSGSPILSGATGTVIGVALSSDNPASAKVIGFQALRIPDDL